MIPVRPYEQSLKEQEAEKEKQKITSSLIEDATFNMLINKKRQELSDKEFLRWLDEIRRYDQKKSELIEQYKTNKSPQKKIKEEPNPQNFKKLKIFDEIEKQLELEEMNQQIKQKVRKAQNEIDRSRLCEFIPKRDNVQFLFKSQEELTRKEQNKKDLEEYLLSKKKQQTEDFQILKQVTHQLNNELHNNQSPRKKQKSKSKPKDFLKKKDGLNKLVKGQPESLKVPGLQNQQQEKQKANQKNPSNDQVSCQNKSDLIKQSGCLISSEVPASYEEVQKKIKIYKIEYFDPSIELPKPFPEDITEEYLNNIYVSVTNEQQENKNLVRLKYKVKQYFASTDPRFLKINKDEKLECIAILQEWFLMKNEFGQVGLCAEAYLQKI